MYRNNDLETEKSIIYLPKTEIYNNTLRKEVDVDSFEMWNTSISMIFGETPKCTMVCGNCKYVFSKRFKLSLDFNNGLPKALCPACRTINRVPIKIS